ncbi:GNAT family N-acetyltransferase [Rhodocytophaga rosea]|uniref:GNAT family N-acetyltransferase n=1 Tax=Rhodocytophaga rosea TaxID=2704465 RepID=A0A6C0GF07_9BACT|nr:GNAT family N-acetyltransferase [Rhodocytophaga rosea]QHT66575.1 GNAT family N-acetyltransferase [Rhodocytophaga rosea]
MAETQFGEYLISTDKSRLDIGCIHDFLSNHSYWAKGIPIETVRRSIEHCMAFGVYHGRQQVGFARVISDNTTFAYLGDVFIVEEHRKKGLSKALVRFILAQPEFGGLRRFLLATRDAHSLYASFGFEPLKNPESFMNIHHPNVYADNGQ